MENITRLIITVLFISLIAISIIFFGILVMGPLTATNKIGKIFRIESSSPVVFTEEQTSSQKTLSQSQNPTPAPINQNTLQNTNQSTTAQLETNLITKPESNTTPPFIPSPPPNPSPNPSPTLSPNDYELIEQSNMISPNDIPQNSLQITIKNGQIVPNVITANAGTITLYITSGDNFVHVFKFDNQDLGQIAIGVPPFSTRFLKFKLLKPGMYGFHDDVPSNQQTTGKLIIQ